MSSGNEYDSYVECVECGHPLERHSTSGCDWQAEGCTCPARWTKKAIREQRRAAGLRMRFNSWEY